MTRPAEGMEDTVKRPAQREPDLEVVAKAERFLNRVLAYQAAIAVHQLKEDLGLDVEELTMSVSPIAPEAVGAYRVICTIVRASGPEPVVLELVVEPDKAVASNGKKSAD